MKAFVESARKVIEIAQRASKKLEDVLGDGMKAVDYIKKFGLENVISGKVDKYSPSLHILKIKYPFIQNELCIKQYYIKRRAILNLIFL